MTPAQHAPGQHLPSCSSPETCAEYGSLLSMTPAEQCAWILQDRARLRTASARPRQFRGAQQESFAPPDPFAADLARRLAATATPASTFEAQYKATRTRELEAEYAEADARQAVQPAPRLMSAAELKKFEAPNGHQLALDALKKEIR